MNKDYDTYNNFETTDFNSNPLINPKLNDYFNNIINQPEPQRNYVILSKSDYSWSNFYHDYIEPNMLFIIIIMGFVIFFLIRYYTMDYDINDDNDTNTTLDKLDDSDDSDDSGLNSRSKKKYKSKLKKYKKDLDEEKKKILYVIDELSSINYEEKKYYSSIENNYNQQLQQIKELQKKQEMQDLEEIRQLKELQQQIVSGNIILPKQNKLNELNELNQPKQKNSNTGKKFIEPDRHPLDLTIKNNDTESDEDSNYYNIKKYNKKNKDDFISDIYIEPPYN